MPKRRTDHREPDSTALVMLHGGSAEGQTLALYVPGHETVVDGKRVLRVLVKAATGEHQSLERLNSTIRLKGAKFDESEKVARRIARNWHIEDYTHRERVYSWAESVHHYDLVARSRIAAIPDDTHWIVVPANRLRAAEGEGAEELETAWSAARTDVEQAVESFHRIAELFPKELYRAQLEAPRQAVEHARAEARRLAAVGEELERIDDTSGTLAAALEATSDQLAALKDDVIEAVRHLTEIQLDVPRVLPSLTRQAGRDDLIALHGASRELASGG